MDLRKQNWFEVYGEASTTIILRHEFLVRLTSCPGAPRSGDSDLRACRLPPPLPGQTSR